MTERLWRTHPLLGTSPRRAWRGPWSQSLHKCRCRRVAPQQQRLLLLPLLLLLGLLGLLGELLGGPHYQLVWQVLQALTLLLQHLKCRVGRRQQ